MATQREYELKSLKVYKVERMKIERFEDIIAWQKAKRAFNNHQHNFYGSSYPSPTTLTHFINFINFQLYKLKYNVSRKERNQINPLWSLRCLVLRPLRGIII